MILDHPESQGAIREEQITIVRTCGLCTWAARGLATVAIVACLIAGCAHPPTPKQVVNGVLRAADIVCILAHAELRDTPAVLEACGIEAALEPAVVEVMGARRDGACKP